MDFEKIRRAAAPYGLTIRKTTRFSGSTWHIMFGSLTVEPGKPYDDEEAAWLAVWREIRGRCAWDELHNAIAEELNKLTPAEVSA